MYNQKLIRDILTQILKASKRIERRFLPIKSPDDFLITDDGIDRLDAICMMLIAIGESLNALIKISEENCFHVILLLIGEVQWVSATL